ncbi:hypothetical protein MHB84_00770 [Paenibacillus sp. FSL F4-0087]|uniref:hypothetical protein n=1 Tax=Paenibacillus sp. FSL F4-0087 TaxID=2921368 RepID=UPI000F743ECB
MIISISKKAGTSANIIFMLRLGCSRTLIRLMLLTEKQNQADNPANLKAAEAALRFAGFMNTETL